MKNGWTWIEPAAQDIEQLRDELRGVVPDGWIEEEDPHVSLLPGFEAPADEMGNVLTACAEASEDIVGSDLTVTGFHCFHPLEADEETFVIGLDVDVDVSSTRELQQACVEAAGGELLYDPVPAHITLFKEGDADDDTSGLTSEQETMVAERLEEIRDEAVFEVPVNAAPAEQF